MTVAAALIRWGLVACSLAPTGVFAAEQSTNTLRVMSLNIYGWATMPDQAHRYADLVNSLDIDVLGIQEGVDDWKIQGMPTDYSRSEALAKALGDCWSHHYQVFYKKCQDVKLFHHERFDLTDGPNAVRTGELASLVKNEIEFLFVNVHWDHQSREARESSARQTAQVVIDDGESPVIVVGDFNSACTGDEVSSMIELAGLHLVVDGGIDCVISRSLKGSGHVVDANPSDHPGVVAEFSLPVNGSGD